MLKRASSLEDEGMAGDKGKGKGKGKRRRVVGSDDHDEKGSEEEEETFVEVDVDAAEFDLCALWDSGVSDEKEADSALAEIEIEGFDLSAAAAAAASESRGGQRDQAPCAAVAVAAAAAAASKGDDGDSASSDTRINFRSKDVPTALMELIESVPAGTSRRGSAAEGRREGEGEGGQVVPSEYEVDETPRTGHRETILAAQEAIRVAQEQRLRRYIALASSGFKATGALEEIARHLEVRAERLKQDQGSSSGPRRSSPPPGGSCGLDFTNPWTGIKPLADLVESLRHSRADQVGHPAAAIVGRVCRSIMEQVVLLDDEELEKEGLESLGLLVRNLYPMVAYKGDQMMPLVFKFVAELVLRHIRAKPLPMRVWGWEQASRLIDLGRRHRWYFKAYLVEGAGSERCNGIYRVSSEDEKNAHHRTPRLRRSLAAPTYLSQSEDGCFVRMKQYKMLSTKALWWFISEPDPARPGLEGDVKYYCRISQPAENCMPPRASGWLKRDAGCGRPPTVTPLVSEGYLCPPGQEYKSLEWELANWMVDNKVVEEIFRERIHRDVVLHSGKLLQFLCGMEDKLKPEHIDLIWRSCMKESSADLQGAVYKVLVVLVKNMNLRLVVHLIGRLQEAVDGDGDWGGRDDVLAFLDCLAQDEDHVVIARSKAARSALAGLVWSLLMQPSVLRHKSCKPVSTLLASVSYRASSVPESEGEVDHGMFLARCVVRWQEQSLADEAEALRSIEAVCHMLENFELKHVREMVQLFYGFPRDPDAQSQVIKFIAESGSFAECYICSEPLLNNIGNSKFGLVSWRCRCTVARKAHSACIFSKICHGQSDCDMCHTPMSFAKASGHGQEVTVRVHSPVR